MFEAETEAEAEGVLVTVIVAIVSTCVPEVGIKSLLLS